MNVSVSSLYFLSFVMLALVSGMGKNAHARPNSQNSIEVYFMVNATPPLLDLYANGSKIDIIDFPKSKQYIRFKFPEGYTDFDMRVFEMNEVQHKVRILNLYQQSKEKGLEAFDKQWKGKGSSNQKGFEFMVNAPADKYMNVRNHNRDGTHEGTLHDYIVHYKVAGIRYLQDPRIRNRD